MVVVVHPSVAGSQRPFATNVAATREPCGLRCGSVQGCVMKWAVVYVCCCCCALAVGCFFPLIDRPRHGAPRLMNWI